MNRRPGFTFADLFAGIGGFHLAMRSLGGQCVFASEIDPEARTVYVENHDFKPRGDIRLIEAADVPEHDVLCAGFPCQAFSKAGSQLGLADQTRGTLFFEIARILELRRPRFFILENVRNLTQHDGGKTWQIIITRLRRLGYRVSSRPLVFSPHLLPPSSEGTPQFRERVFIMGEHRDHAAIGGSGDWELGVENAPLDGWDPQRWDLRSWLASRPHPGKDADRYSLTDDEVTWLRAWGDFARRIGDRLPGFPLWEMEFKRRPGIRGLPEWKQGFHRKNSDFYRRHESTIDQWRARWRVQDFPKSRRKFEWQAQDAPRHRIDDVFKLLIHMRPSGIRVKRPTFTPALVAITQTPIIGWEKRRITPREAASLQGLPPDFILHSNDATAYRQLGNGVHVGVVKFLARRMFEASGFWPREGDAVSFPPSTIAV